MPKRVEKERCFLGTPLLLIVYFYALYTVKVRIRDIVEVFGVIRQVPDVEKIVKSPGYIVWFKHVRIVSKVLYLKHPYIVLVLVIHRLSV